MTVFTLTGAAAVMPAALAALAVMYTLGAWPSIFASLLYGPFAYFSLIGHLALMKRLIMPHMAGGGSCSRDALGGEINAGFGCQPSTPKCTHDHSHTHQLCTPTATANNIHTLCCMPHHRVPHLQEYQGGQVADAGAQRTHLQRLQRAQGVPGEGLGCLQKCAPASQPASQ